MPAQNDNKNVHKIILNHLTDLLNEGNAHVTLDDALEDINFNITGKIPAGLPYSIWQLAEHIRIAQADILSFSSDDQYKKLNWPNDYWPEETEPPSEHAWKECINQIKQDRALFIHLLENGGDHLFIPFKYGTGQSLFREALLIADHNSYHTGEIIMMRRLLGDWKQAGNQA